MGNYIKEVTENYFIFDATIYNNGGWELHSMLIVYTFNGTNWEFHSLMEPFPQSNATPIFLTGQAIEEKDGELYIDNDKIKGFKYTDVYESIVTETTTPSARDSHLSVIYNNNLYVFGGMGDYHLADLWKMDLEMSQLFLLIVIHIMYLLIF